MKKKNNLLKSCGLILGGASVIVMIYNRLINIISNSKDHLPIENGKFYPWRYGKIYYTKTGFGSPILLIHDLDSSSSSYEWDKVINRLSKKNTVYAIDLLGCGRSEKPNLTYTNFLYVQLINDFIKHVIKARTTVIATGSSFSFSLMASQMEPKYFSKLIGVSPMEITEMAKLPTRKYRLYHDLFNIPLIGNLIYNIAMSKNAILDKMTKDDYYKDYLIPDKTLLSYYHAAHQDNGKGRFLYASIAGRYTNINIAPALKKTDASIHLIGGKEMDSIDFTMDEYTSLNPSIEVAYIPKAKKLPQLETPEKFVKLVEIILNTK